MQSSKWIAVAVGLVAAAALVLHARSYPLVTYDDAFISLRYSQRLLGGHGLTWTEGPRVEGYSNLLWVLGCAGLAAMGVALVMTPVVLGVASAVALIAAVLVAHPPRSWSRSLPAFAGAMFLVLAGPIALWAVSGLEGCLVAALLAWALVWLKPLVNGESTGWRAVLLPSIPLALLCLTRPDGPLVSAAVSGFLLFRARSKQEAAHAVGVSALPAAVTLGQIAFRLVYYGDWLPNTARAKVAFTAARLESGTACVADAARSSYALWIPAAVAVYIAWRDPRRRPVVMLLLGLLAVWTLYASTITCQQFGYRMLIPCYVVLAFLVAEVVDWLQEHDKVPWPVAWAGALGLLAVFHWTQQRDINIAMARWNNPPVTVRAESIGNALRVAFGDADPLLAVDAAGAIPFFAEMRSLDMLGLNDAHIARHHDASFGKGVQGHELGDGAYVLSRKPDLIVAGVNGSSRLAFRGGREMDASPEFHRDYRRVRMTGADPVPTKFNFFARLDGRAGLRRTADEVLIPGYLLAHDKGTQAGSLEDGGVVTRFVEAAQTTLPGIALEPGTWRVTVTGEGAMGMALRGREDDGGEIPAQGDQIALPEGGSIDISVTGAPSTIIRQVAVTRVDSG